MAEDDLPDPLHPGDSARSGNRASVTDFPKGDLRVASWIALISGILVVVWYLAALILGGIYFTTVAAGVIQIIVWALAVVSFVCGLLCLNARRHREFAAAGFIAGVVALLVTVTLGLSAGLQLIL